MNGRKSFGAKKGGDQTGTAHSKAGTARFYSMAAVALSRPVTPVTPVTPPRLARDQRGLAARFRRSLTAAQAGSVGGDWISPTSANFSRMNSSIAFPGP